MNEFTITMRLTKASYIKAFYEGFYKRPITILLTAISIFLIVSALFDSSGSSSWNLVIGIAGLLLPTFVVLMASRTFASNPNFGRDIVYTFTNDGIASEGATFKVEMQWVNIIKQKDTKAYLILYNSKNLGSLIDKSKLTPEQIQFIKAKVAQNKK